MPFPISVLLLLLFSWPVKVSQALEADTLGFGSCLCCSSAELLTLSEAQLSPSSQSCDDFLGPCMSETGYVLKVPGMTRLCTLLSLKASLRPLPSARSVYGQKGQLELWTPQPAVYLSLLGANYLLLCAMVPSVYLFLPPDLEVLRVRDYVLFISVSQDARPHLVHTNSGTFFSELN